MSGSPVSEWIKFFKNAGLAPSVSSHYATIFVDNRMRTKMLPDLTKDFLKDMGINAVGDIIAILKHSKAFYSASRTDSHTQSDEDTGGSSVDSGVRVARAGDGSLDVKRVPSIKRKPAAPNAANAKILKTVAPPVVAAIKRNVGDISKKPASPTVETSGRPTFPVKKRTLASDEPAKLMAKARIQAQNKSLHDRFSTARISGAGNKNISKDVSDSDSDSSPPSAKAPRMTPAALLFAKKKELESQRGKSVSASILSRLKLPSDSPTPILRESPKPAVRPKPLVKPRLKSKESDTAVFRRLDGSKEKVINFKVQVGNEKQTAPALPILSARKTTNMMEIVNENYSEIDDDEPVDDYYDDADDDNINSDYEVYDDGEDEEFEEENDEEFEEEEDEDDVIYDDEGEYDDNEDDQFPSSSSKMNMVRVADINRPRVAEVSSGVLGGRIKLTTRVRPRPVPEPRDALKYSGVLKSPSKSAKRPAVSNVKARLGVKQRLGTPKKTLCRGMHSDQDAVVSSTTADIGSLRTLARGSKSRQSALARLHRGMQVRGAKVPTSISKTGVLSAGRLQTSVKDRLGGGFGGSSARGSAGPKVILYGKSSVFNRLGVKK